MVKCAIAIVILFFTVFFILGVLEYNKQNKIPRSVWSNEDDRM